MIIMLILISCFLFLEEKLLSSFSEDSSLRYLKTYSYSSYSRTIVSIRGTFVLNTEW